MNHASLFSGIGGFDLAAEYMGWQNVFNCEINPFCTKILNFYWPNSESFSDITKTNFTKYANKINVLSGGFPCQPYSLSGRRKGKEDDRHLWPEMLRAIKEIQPVWIVGENVHGIVNWSKGMVFHEVQTQMEIEGYEVFAFILPSSSVGTIHKRERVFFVAHSQRARLEYWRKNNNLPKKERKTLKKRRCFAKQFKTNGGKFNPNWTTDEKIKRLVCRRNNVFSKKLHGITFSKWRKESLQGYGNAVVPKLILQIFKTIEDYENSIKQNY